MGDVSKASEAANFAIPSTNALLMPSTSRTVSMGSVVPEPGPSTLVMSSASSASASTSAAGRHVSFSSNDDLGDDAFDFDSVMDNEPLNDDDSVALPAKSINQIIKDTLGDTRISVDCRDAVHSCCLSFIREISRVAQRLSAQDQRKTITHEHVIQALSAMNFPPAYREAAGSVLAECQEHAHRRLKRKHSRLENCGIPEEELLKQQQQLFEQARQQQQALEDSGLAEYRAQLAQMAASASSNGSSSEHATASGSTNKIALDDDYDE